MRRFGGWIGRSCLVVCWLLFVCERDGKIVSEEEGVDLED